MVPKQRTFSLIYFASILCLILSVTMLITFVSGITKTLDKDGNTIYRTPSKSLLIVSLIFTFFSIILLIINVRWYYKIFSFEKSTLLYSFIVLGIINLILLGMAINYLTKPNLCPKGQIFSKTYNKCIDTCEVGTIYDGNSGKCVSGCSDAYPCQEGILCVGGQCCTNTNDTNCNNECCPEGHCRDGKSCCSTPLCNGKCCGDIGKCIDDNCKIICGSTFCPEGQACMEIDVGSDQYADFTKEYTQAEIKDGKAYACVNTNNKCKPNANTQIFPTPIALNDRSSTLFYPILEGGNPEINSRSQNKFGDRTWQIDLNNDTDNLGHAGGYCGNGFSNPTRYLQYELEGENCSYQNCVDLAFPDITTNVALQTNGDKQYCNYVLNYGDSFKGLSSYKLNYYDTKQNPQTETRNFQPPQSTSSLSATTFPKTFVKDCLQFTECPVVNNAQYSCNPPNPSQSQANWLNQASDRKCQMVSKPFKPVSTKWKVVSSKTPSNTPIQYQSTITLQAVKDSSDTSFNDQFLSNLKAGHKNEQSPCMKESSDQAASLLLISTDLTQTGNVMTGDTFYLQCVSGEFKGSFLSTSCNGTNTPCWSPNHDVDEIWSFYDDSFMKKNTITSNKPVFLQKSTTKSFDSVPFLGNAVVATSTSHYLQPCMQDNTLILNYDCQISTYDPRNICAGKCSVAIPQIVGGDQPAICDTPSADMKSYYDKSHVDSRGQVINFITCCDAKATQDLITDNGIPNDGHLHPELLQSCGPGILTNSYLPLATDMNAKNWSFQQ
jgi:hypothetical protein